MSFLTKIFGSSNQRALKKMQVHVDQINLLESHYQGMDDAEIAELKDTLKTTYSDDINNLLPHAFAATREASVRATGLRHFDSQMLGGIALADGNIDPNQTNLFDCFDLNDDHGIRGLGQRAAEPNLQDPAELDDITHPVNTFLNFLPDDHGDDPLLAIACQLMLFVVESVMGKGEPVATLESIFVGMTEHGVNVKETEEALEHLLSTGGLVEVDDDFGGEIKSPNIKVDGYPYEDLKQYLKVEFKYFEVL